MRLFLFSLPLLLFGQTAHAQNTSNFTITSFDADYFLSRNDKDIAQMDVQETVTAQFPNFDQNHGILRAIPKTYKGYSVGIKLQSVTDDQNVPYQYTISTDNGNLVLKIGDPSRYVRGQNVYKIHYSLSNVISFQDTHDELYWDVNGDQWQQPFGMVNARVHIPDDIAANLLPEKKCFTGTFGSTEQNCLVSQSDENGGTVITIAAGNLSAGETLTYVLGFQKGTFKPDRAAQLKVLLVGLLIIGGIILPPLIIIFVMFKKWRKFGRDPKGRGTIIAEYTPPKGFSVLSSSMILHDNVSTKAVTATIIDLAVRRYVNIIELDKKKYSLELVNNFDDLKLEEQDVLKLFFDTMDAGETVKLSDLKYKLAKKTSELGRSVAESLTKKGYYSQDPEKIRSHYYKWGGLFCLLGFLLFFTVYLLPLGVGLLIGGVIELLFARYMPARTLKGVEARDALLGLKVYMDLAEKDRIKYLQSPQGVKQFGDPTKPENKVHLYEKLLPYAILMGVEKQWSKQFKDIYDEQPEWFRGNISSFNTGYLVGSLNSFNSATSATFSSPSSSGGSGFSSGGGFSGGGGGGGGGGGW